MKSVFIVLMLFLVSGIASAQTYKLPDVIPPSPQASEIVKFHDFPMDLSTGLATIDIPIYQIKSEELSVPISISYHASGLKPNEAESGVLGLSWNLNCFGIISRSIKEQADERHWNYLIPLESSITSTTDNTVADPDASILDNIVRGYRESEPDIFSYSMPGGGGGKFVFKRNSTLSEFLKPVTLPFKPVKITPNLIQENGTNVFDYFEIKDENGVLYRFGKSASTGQVLHEQYFNINDYLEKGITSWLLTEIISTDKSDTIYFEYDDVTGVNGGTSIIKRHHGFSKSLSVTRTDGSSTETRTPSQSGIFTAYGYSQKKVTRIRFKSGYVKFLYKSNAYPDQQLDRIEVYSKDSGSPIQTIRFTQTKYHASSSSLNWYKLDEVKFYDANNTAVNKYSFTYAITGFPSIQDTYTNETFAIDFFGYYNGGINSDLMPSFQWSPVANSTYNLFGSANRNPNYQHAMAGILTGMVNQTAGEHIFEYEGNTNYLGQPVGGLRIKKIIHKTGDEEIRKKFTYSNGSSVSIDQTYFQSHSVDIGIPTPEPGYHTSTYTASSEPNYSVTINGSPVLYGKVTESLEEGTANNGWIEHYFDYSFTSPLKYDYSSIALGYPWNSVFSATPMLVYYNDVVPGNVFEKETRVFNSSGNLVRTTNNYYSHGVKQRSTGFTVSRIVSTTTYPQKAYFFGFYNYNIDQLGQKLDSTIVIDYQDSELLVKKEKYTYNGNLFVIEKKSQKSDGSWNISQFKYPGDFAAIAPYDEMVNDRNMIAPVVEKLEYAGTTPLQSLKTNYMNWGNNVVAPQSVDVKVGSASYEKRLEYLSYDNTGNVTSVSKDAGPAVSYVWGYKRSLPVIEAKNVSQADLTLKVGQALVETGYINGINDLDIFLASLGNMNTDSQKNSWRLFNQKLQEKFTQAYVSVSTHTYNPLVGKTSVTDTNIVAQYYEYDSFGRLSCVKDNAGNILKTYTYHYKQ